MSLTTFCKKALATILGTSLLLLAISATGKCAEKTVPAPPTIEELIEAMTPGARRLHLSLEDCIAAALKNNLDIQVDQYVPGISDAEVSIQEGVFDPHVYFNVGYFDGEIPFPVRVSVSTGGLTGINIKQWFMTGGITGGIPLGLFYDLGIVSEHTPYSTITDLFDANGEQKFDAYLTITQPLLKNFGSDVNTIGIRSAAKNKEASAFQLEQTILDTVFEVEQAYWELFFAYQDLRVKSYSLLLVEDLLEENKVRLKVGVVPPLAVLQSEAGVAVREQDLIVARSVVEDARDRLIKATNLFPEELVWDVQLVPTDAPYAEAPEKMVEGKEIDMALRNRPELKQLYKQQEAAELGSRYAKNQLLPSLDINASIGFIGLDDDYDSSAIPQFFSGLPPLGGTPDKGIDSAFDDLVSGDNFQWMLGFTFEVPWGNHTARGDYTSANLLVSQLDTTIRSLRQAIIQDVRNAIRSVDTSWESVLTIREVTRFRRESLLAEKKKYDVGVVTTHDLLEFEEELAQALAGEQRALVDYTISLSNLMRANATLLEARSVRVTVEP